jgi:hypothetical protein
MTTYEDCLENDVRLGNKNLAPVARDCDSAGNNGEPSEILPQAVVASEQHPTHREGCRGRDAVQVSWWPAEISLRRQMQVNEIIEGSQMVISRTLAICQKRRLHSHRMATSNDTVLSRASIVAVQCSKNAKAAEPERNDSGKGYMMTV